MYFIVFVRFGGVLIQETGISCLILNEDKNLFS